jgi:hypothetical protein
MPALHTQTKYCLQSCLDVSMHWPNKCNIHDDASIQVLVAMFACGHACPVMLVC